MPRLRPPSDMESEMGTASRQKGVRGERELIAVLQEKGFKAKRGLQFRGGVDAPDVVCTTLPFHLEVKRQERMRMELWMKQAREDAAVYGKVAAVFHKANNKRWTVTFDLEDFLDWYALDGGPDVGLKFRNTNP